MNLLEEFWYRNIEPAEYDASPTKNHNKRSTCKLDLQVLLNYASNVATFGRFCYFIEKHLPVAAWNCKSPVQHKTELGF